jgi:protein gp37
VADKSGIEWTDATWNPVVGCEKVSPGCDHCYAIRDGARLQHLAAYAGTIADGDWTGVVRELPERLDVPLRWQKPRKVFVNSMSDLFHPDVSRAFIEKVFDVMARAERHTFQVLTKRPARMAKLTHDRLATPEEVDGGHELGIVPGLWDLVNSGIPAPNVHLGTSVESNEFAWRADRLRETAAAVRFLSIEPLLGPVDGVTVKGLDWIIVGGESGHGARPLDLGWIRDLRDQCSDEGVPLFVKQLGIAWGPDHKHPEAWPADLRIREYPA